MTRVDRTQRPTVATPPKEVLGDDHLTWVWVGYQLSCRRRTLAGVAQTLGVERQTLYHTHRKPYPRMEKGLADALGLRPEQIWPHRYTVNGLPAGAVNRARRAVEKYNHGGKRVRETKPGSNVNKAVAA